MSEADPTLHLGLAEHGKLLALRGQHAEAMRHYREAIRLAASQSADDGYVRTYTLYMLDSLEHSGALAEVITLCERAEAHYANHPPVDGWARMDRANHLLRKGVVLFKLGRLDEAAVSLERAIAEARPNALPMAATALRWVQNGAYVDPGRIRAEQDRHHYFAVRRDTVNKAVAIALPTGYAA